MTMKAVYVLLVLLVLVLHAPLPSLTLSCLPCDKSKCPTLNCKGGKVPGLCGCCQACAKIEGEKCGGPFGIDGKCDKGLECDKDPVDYYTYGICVKECPMKRYCKVLLEWRQELDKWIYENKECQQNRNQKAELNVVQ